MIYDKENAFIFDKDVSTTPDVIANGMGGNEICCSSYGGRRDHAEDGRQRRFG